VCWWFYVYIVTILLFQAFIPCCEDFFIWQLPWRMCPNVMRGVTIIISYSKKSNSYHIRLRTNRRSHHDSKTKNMENLGTAVERSLLLLVRDRISIIKPALTYLATMEWTLITLDSILRPTFEMWSIWRRYRVRDMGDLPQMKICLRTPQIVVRQWCDQSLCLFLLRLQQCSETNRIKYALLFHFPTSCHRYIRQSWWTLQKKQQWTALTLRRRSH